MLLFFPSFLFNLSRASTIYLKSNLSSLLTHTYSLSRLSFCDFLHIMSFLFSHPWLAATSAHRPCYVTNFIAMKNVSIFVLRQLLPLHGMKIAWFFINGFFNVECFYSKNRILSIILLIICWSLTKRKLYTLSKNLT